MAALNVLAICTRQFVPFPWAELCCAYRQDPTEPGEVLASMKEAEIHSSHHASLPSHFHDCLGSLTGAADQAFDYDYHIKSFATAVPGEFSLYRLLIE